MKHEPVILGTETGFTYIDHDSIEGKIATSIESRGKVDMKDIYWEIYELFPILKLVNQKYNVERL